MRFISSVDIDNQQQEQVLFLNMFSASKILRGLTNVMENFGDLRMLPLSTAITVTTERWCSVSILSLQGSFPPCPSTPLTICPPQLEDTYLR